MNQDPNEKDMIGDLLDDSFENVAKIKKTYTSNRPSALQINQNHNQSPIYYPRVYSPQVQQKQNSYDLDLRLTKVPVQQSAPNSALKLKSYDHVAQFNLDDETYLEGDLISKCKDQNGARNIQKTFQEGSQAIREQIFNKLEKGLLSLSKDVFGNYVIQNLLEFGTSIQQQKILTILLPHSSQLAFHQYGCRVLQKLLENTHNTVDFPMLFDTIKNKVRELVIDQHGNHVVQKLIQLMEKDISLWVLDGIEGQINKLVINSFGCRIIQKAVSISNNHPDKQMKILNEIIKLTYELCVSQYGNYIIQQLLKEGPPIIKNIIQQIIMEKLEEYSLNKFGRQFIKRNNISNVVDCAIKFSDNQFKLKIMELLLSHNNSQILFVRLSTNAYGNYVVQNFLKYADSEIQKELYLKITNNQQLLQEIQQYKFGTLQNQYLSRSVCLLNVNLEIRIRNLQFMKCVYDLFIYVIFLEHCQKYILQLNMQKTQPVSRDSQIFETLNYKDDSIQVQDLDFFGPWHKQNNSIQQQIAQIRKTYTTSSNHMQNEIIERPETQNSQIRMINTTFHNKRRKTRKISIDQSSQLIEKPKYNESRQVQRIIQDFFTDENKEKRKKQRNYGFFIPSTSKSNSNTKCNGSSFQTTQAYFDKIALKMLKLNLQKSPSKLTKPLKNVNIKQKLILDMPINTKGYFPPQLLINTTKTKQVTPQNLNSSQNKLRIKNLNFLAKTGKGSIWKVNNYTSI